MLFAHGVGSRGDLPLPLWQFAWAAVAALGISFLALGILWKQPVLARLAQGRPVAVLDRLRPVVGPILRTLSFALFVLIIVAGFFGVDSSSDNIAPTAIFVAFWVGLSIFAGLFGDLWPTLSPFDTMAGVLFRNRAPVEAPDWSYWLAPAGILGFLLVELAHPFGDSPRVLAWAAVIYTVIMLAAAWRWGREWLVRGESFSRLFSLFGAMAPFGRNDEGRIVVRAPFSGLTGVDSHPATTATHLIGIGGTSFDGFKESELGRDLLDFDGRWTGALGLSVGLVVSVVLIAALYLAATWFTAEVTGGNWRTTTDDFASTLVPILWGYTVAHYAQLLIDEMQSFIFLLSDPLGKGRDFFGGADATINFDIVSVDGVAWLQVIGIIVGHIAAVVVAHDRSIDRYNERDATRSQFLMLFVMVLYSVLGLWLLLNA